MIVTPENSQRQIVSLLQTGFENIIGQARNNLILLMSEGRIDVFLSGFANPYKCLDVVNVEGIDVLPVPFYTHSVALCKRVRLDTGSVVYFSLDGFMLPGRNQGRNYRCTIPFVFLSCQIPTKEEQQLCRYFGMQMSIYFNPDNINAMTTFYNLGYFEVNKDPRNRVDMGGWKRVRSAVRFGGRLLPSCYYRSKFKSLGTFNENAEDEEAVRECIQAILDEISR